MITDEQIEEVCDSVLDINSIDWAGIHGKDYCDIEEFAKALIEKHEKSRWNKFDENDESTWPENSDDVLCMIDKHNNRYSIDVCTYDRDDGLFFIGDYTSVIVTHWQSLPEPPQK